jgi:hypothetical protein
MLRTKHDQAGIDYCNTPRLKQHIQLHIRYISVSHVNLLEHSITVEVDLQVKAHVVSHGA